MSIGLESSFPFFAGFFCFLTISIKATIVPRARANRIVSAMMKRAVLWFSCFVGAALLSGLSSLVISR